MELQYHPSTGRRTVSVVSLGPRGERVVVALVAAVALLALSLWATAPRVLTRAAREARLPALERELSESRAAGARVRDEAGRWVVRALGWGDELAKIAFLYGVAPARWPRALDPQRLLAARSEDLPDAAKAYLGGLERARAALAAREAADPDLAARTPAIAPIAGAVFEPATFFGPRVSPWTGQSEFFCGLDLAAAEGSAVVAPADGRVVFAGRAQRGRAPRLWQFGTLIVLSHGPRIATVFGHLARADVRRGSVVRRGERLGTVGKTGWAVSPRLHYEVWTFQEGALRPTDPLFAILDRRVDDRHRSLAEMLATSAPEPAGGLPGLD